MVECTKAYTPLHDVEFRLSYIIMFTRATHGHSDRLSQGHKRRRSQRTYSQWATTNSYHAQQNTAQSCTPTTTQTPLQKQHNYNHRYNQAQPQTWGRHHIGPHCHLISCLDGEISERCMFGTLGSSINSIAPGAEEQMGRTWSCKYQPAGAF